MSTRPRGLSPTGARVPETILALNQAKAARVVYVGQLPLTLRQIFYRLVGVYAYEKFEQAYKRLTELAQ